LFKCSEIADLEPILNDVYVFAPFKFKHLAGLKAQPTEQSDINLVNKTSNSVRGVPVRIGDELRQIFMQEYDDQIRPEQA
jgi:hypothetical protein